jgi:hypothetical protein
MEYWKLLRVQSEHQSLVSLHSFPFSREILAYSSFYLYYIYYLFMSCHAFIGSSYGLGYGGAYHNRDAWLQ